MSIKIQGQTIVDNDKNIIDANSATFQGNGAFYRSLALQNGYGAGTDGNAALFTRNAADDTTTSTINYDGSATFAGTVDAAGFTVNGTALSTGGGDVSTLVETATGTTVAEAKTDSDGDRVLDLNTMVIGVDLGSFYLGKDEVNTPWHHGIYMDGTDSNNNDQTRILLYGTGSSDAALQIVDGVNSKNGFWLSHDGQAQFAVENDYTSGINIIPNASSDNRSIIDIYSDGTSTSSAFRVYDGANSKTKMQINHDGGARFGVENDYTSGILIYPNSAPDNQSNIDIYSDGTSTSSAFRVYDGANSKTKVQINHDGNATFNLNSTSWSEGIRIRANESTGSVIDVYNDGTKTYSAFRVYDSDAGYDKINLYHDGNAGFNLDTTNWDQGVKIFGTSQYGSGVTVYRDSTISEHTGAVFRAYDKATDTNSVAFYGNGNGFFEGSAFTKQALIAHTDGTGEVKIWKGASVDSDSTGVGWSVLNSTTSGTHNTAFGVAAAQNLTTGGRNTALGHTALRGDGTTPSNNTGNGNVAVGDACLYENTSGSYNTAVGKSSCIDNTTAEYNTGIGGFALFKNQTSSYNTAVGYTALYNQQSWNQGTALGAFAGRYDTSGNDSANFYDTTCIGYNSRASGHYQVVLGDTNAYTYTNGGSVYSLSDARDKTDIRDTVMGLDFIKSLRPVDYRWDYREDYLQFDPETGDHTPMPRDGSKKRTRFHHGLIAQEVKSAADGLGVDFAGFQDHTINGGGERMTLGYSEFIGPLIKAVQELSAENAALKARLDAAGL